MTSPRLCVCCRQRPEAVEWRPFCSERCKRLDLAAWAEGRYRIPGEPVAEAEDPPARDEHDPEP